MAIKKKPTAPKRPPGRPEHQPDFNTRRLVKALAFEGATQRRIAMHLEIDEKTLCKWYRGELDLSVEMLCSLVAQNLARVALRPNGGQPTVNAAKFVLSCRAGWREVSKIEVQDHGRGIGAILKILADSKRDAEDEEAGLAAQDDFPTHMPSPASH